MLAWRRDATSLLAEALPRDSLFWLGVGVTLCYIPGHIGASIPTSWPVLSVVVPIFLLQREIEMTPLHWLGVCFVAWASATVFWSAAPWDAIGELWHIWILAGMFCLGAAWGSSRGLLCGYIFGMTLVCLLGFAQFFGLDWPYQYTAEQRTVTGLFVNANMFGALVALALTGALAERQWYFLPFGITTLFLGKARVPLLAFGIAYFLWQWKRDRAWAAIVSVPLALGAVGVVFLKSTNTLHDRLLYWIDVIPQLDWWGYGPQAFLHLYPLFARTHDVLQGRPLHMYNDYLELTFEYGIGVIPLWILLALALESKLETERLVLFTLLVVSAFYFPFYGPLAAPLGAFMAGRMASAWDPVRLGRLHWRHGEPLRSNMGREGLPLRMES